LQGDEPLGGALHHGNVLNHRRAVPSMLSAGLSLLLAAAATAAPNSGSCPFVVPRTKKTSDYAEYCGRSPRNVTECCVTQAPQCNSGCGRNAVEVKGPNRTTPCPVLPAHFLERGFQSRHGPATEHVLGNVRDRLVDASCRLPRTGKDASKLRVVILGGSVTAGSWSRAQAWHTHLLEYLATQAAADPTRLSRPIAEIVDVIPFSTTGMGPSYMGLCYPRHIGDFGGRDPDVVIIEFDVNDFDDNAGVPLAMLVRLMLQRGTAVLVLHHFSPGFAPGMNPGRWPETGERKHVRVAEFFGVSGANMRLAIGSDFRQSAKAKGATARFSQGEGPAEVLELCSFACGFSPDMLHPIECGHRLLAQMAAFALWKTMKAAWPQMGSCEGAASETQPAARRCSRLTAFTRELASRSSATPDFQATPCATVMASTISCLSVTGSPQTWNFFPACPSPSWRMVDLKGKKPMTVETPAGPMSVYAGSNAGGYQLQSNRGVQVYKHLWEGRDPGTSMDFQLDCLLSPQTGYLRIMYMRSGYLHYGRAAVLIDGRVVGVISGHIENKGSLFNPADLPLPPAKKLKSAVVRVVILGGEAKQAAHEGKAHGAGTGFGINAAICVPFEASDLTPVNSTGLSREDAALLKRSTGCTIGAMNISFKHSPSNARGNSAHKMPAVRADPRTGNSAYKTPVVRADPRTTRKGQWGTAAAAGAETSSAVSAVATAHDASSLRGEGLALGLVLHLSGIGFGCLSGYLLAVRFGRLRPATS
jgi:hypothetical protein